MYEPALTFEFRRTVLFKPPEKESTRVMAL